jgi:putative flippase GtrA
MAEKKPRKKLLENQVIRFVLSAGAGFVVDISAYYLFYHNLLTQKRYHIFFFTLKNSSASLALSFFMGVLVNFIITRYFVFSESTSSPQKQFFRFVSVAILGFFANLGVLDLLINFFQMYPPVARPTAALSLFFASYFVHKFFSFSLKRKRHAHPDSKPAHDNA